MPIASGGSADEAHQLAFFHTMLSIFFHLQMGIVRSSLPALRSHLLLLYSICQQKKLGAMFHSTYQMKLFIFCICLTMSEFAKCCELAGT